MREVDYVIVGAGSAGCALAGRLAAAERHQILVLEAGPIDRSVWVHIPIGYGKLYYHPKMNWMYRTEPVPGPNNRVIYQPRGKVVGGSSAVNAMVYSRGQPEDYDGWASGGNPGWSWADVLPIYKRMEDHALGAGALHGAGGPIHITDIRDAVHPLTHRFVAAGQQAGLAFNPDLNGETCEGVGYFQINTKDGLRVSAARAYLNPALRAGRAQLEADALATRVLFEGTRAVGVEYRRHGELHQVRARREVILSGGALNSPQLLQLSGVGPGDLLRRHGIEVVCDRPAVGRNMHDHLCYDHIYRTRVPSLNQELLPLLGKIKAGIQYLLGRKGPLSLSVNQGGGWFRTKPGHNRPDMQLYFSPLSYEKAPPGVRALMQPDPFPGVCSSVSPSQPTSRGHLEIASIDPSAPPRIFPNYLSTPEDVEALLAGAKFLRRLAASPALAEIIAEEINPGPAHQSDSELVADMRARAYSVFHPCSTCRMGPDPADSVVDSKLRAHGLQALRVADASIFPAVTSGNTNAPSMMVGEKAAELLLAE